MELYFQYGKVSEGANRSQYSNTSTLIRCLGNNSPCTCHARETDVLFDSQIGLVDGWTVLAIARDGFQCRCAGFTPSAA